MRSISKYILPGLVFIFVVMLLASLMAPGHARADITQGVDDQYIVLNRNGTPGTGFIWYYQPLGTGITGNLFSYSVTVGKDSLSDPTQNATLFLLECDDQTSANSFLPYSSIPAGCTQKIASGSTLLTSLKQTATITGTTTWDGTKYYTAYVEPGNDTYMRLYGSDQSQFSPDAVRVVQSPDASYSGSDIVSYAFNIDTDYSPEPPNLYSHVVSFDYPALSATTTIGAVGWGFTFYNSDLPDFPRDQAESLVSYFTNLDTYETFTGTSTAPMPGTSDQVTGTTTLSQGHYQWSVWSNNVGGSQTAYGNTWVFTVGDPPEADPVAPIASVEFSCSDFARQQFGTTTCGVVSPLGCLLQAGISLFCPSASSINNIMGIKDLIAAKPPIGYLAAITDQLEQINSSSTPAFSATIPQGVKDYFFTPINIAIASILWWFWIPRFYHRVKDLGII